MPTRDYDLELGREEGAYISVPGRQPKSRPYVWVGSRDKGCFGVIPDKDTVRFLRTLAAALGYRVTKKGGEK